MDHSDFLRGVRNKKIKKLRPQYLMSLVRLAQE